MFAPEVEPSRHPRVKICGLTNEGDARAAVEYGADALGFNLFRGSKRYVDLDAAAKWIGDLPPDVLKVAVLVDPSLAEVMRIAALPFFTSVQLHGSETPAFCHSLFDAGIRFAKALPVTREGVRGNPAEYATPAIVLDSAVGGVFGGSGRAFPWQIAGDFVAAHLSVQVILAGGLTPENVAQAVEIARPFAVDVTSGVESRPGCKDHRRLQDFVAAVRAID